MRSFTKSNQLLAREIEVSPLAAQTYSKSFRYSCRGMAPSYMDHGEGCYIIDVDGNKFLDFICALGPITVGYNDPKVNEAVIKQVGKFASGSLQSELEVELAERICALIPCSEMVRFVKNGSDATTAAIRLARAYTNRDAVLMSGYHGMHDWSIGASENNKGVPKAVSELTVNFEYNNIVDLEQKLSDHEVAAVILEPIQSNGPEEGYLEEVKRVTHKHGAILIFDEVVSGFHYALGGAQELFGVVPDLVAFGKGMGNGYPISAVAGRRDLMKQIEQGVFVSTTFGGDSIAIAASLATLDILDNSEYYTKINQAGTKMRDGIIAMVDKYNLSDVVSVVGLPQHCGVDFSGCGSLSYLDLQSIYSQTMIQNGIILFAFYFLNSHHGDAEVQKYLDANDEAFSLIETALKNDDISGILKAEKVDPVFKRNID